MKLLKIRTKLTTTFLNVAAIISIHRFEPDHEKQGFKVVFADGAAQNFTGPDAAAALDALLASSDVVAAGEPDPWGAFLSGIVTAPAGKPQMPVYRSPEITTTEPGPAVPELAVVG